MVSTTLCYRSIGIVDHDLNQIMIIPIELKTDKQCATAQRFYDDLAALAIKNR